MIFGSIDLLERAIRRNNVQDVNRFTNSKKSRVNGGLYRYNRTEHKGELKQKEPHLNSGGQ